MSLLNTCPLNYCRRLAGINGDNGAIRDPSTTAILGLLSLHAYQFYFAVSPRAGWLSSVLPYGAQCYQLDGPLREY